jgi:hypothetical protein
LAFFAAKLKQWYNINRQRETNFGLPKKERGLLEAQDVELKRRQSAMFAKIKCRLAYQLKNAISIKIIYEIRKKYWKALENFENINLFTKEKKMNL